MGSTAHCRAGQGRAVHLIDCPEGNTPLAGMVAFDAAERLVQASHSALRFIVAMPDGRCGLLPGYRMAL